MTMPDWVGKSEGFVAGALTITVIATSLLVAHLLTEGTWLQAVTVTWGSVVGGGAVAAFRK